MSDDTFLVPIDFLNKKRRSKKTGLNPPEKSSNIGLPTAYVDGLKRDTGKKISFWGIYVRFRGV